MIGVGEGDKAMRWTEGVCERYFVKSKSGVCETISFFVLFIYKKVSHIYILLPSLSKLAGSRPHCKRVTENLDDNESIYKNFSPFPHNSIIAAPSSTPWFSTSSANTP